MHDLEVARAMAENDVRIVKQRLAEVEHGGKQAGGLTPHMAVILLVVLIQVYMLIFQGEAVASTSNQ